MNLSDRKLIVRYVATIVVLALAASVFKAARGAKRGFYLNDPEVNKPMETEIVPNIVLISISFATVVYIGAIQFIPGKHAIFWPKLSAPFYYLFLLAMNLIIMGGTKHFIGELRPDFVARCQLDTELLVTSGSSSTYGPFVQHYTCKGDPEKVAQGRLSFPSGHASISTMAATSLILYTEYDLKPFLIHKKGISPNYVFPFTATLYAMAALMALMISASRFFDHHHHIHDILAGMILGISLSFYGSRVEPQMKQDIELGSPVSEQVGFLESQTPATP